MSKSRAKKKGALIVLPSAYSADMDLRSVLRSIRAARDQLHFVLQSDAVLEDSTLRLIIASREICEAVVNIASTVRRTTTVAADVSISKRARKPSQCSRRPTRPRPRKRAT